ncbi:glycosyltransferase family 4 protein [Ectothiorhodospira marina]|uniref:Glycosyltransferase involved in cell wall bisynthesis n=1 Tax=Ectothiorhodospira marina TaxID=1396821 RepID=A0A1H7RLS3_9GAMM|nr:glycosyltransferase family 4 protein [Ectothiorhodospira marina]SEL60968.1 Glycosyltransferase involved in cell wall bisynthesis [Ectothiorhodospira marina]
MNKTEPLRVLHLVAGNLSGGAARGAYWLHQAQREIGIDSTLVTSGRETGDDPSVIALGKSPIQWMKHAALNRLGNIPVRFYAKRKPWIFNTGFAGIDFTKLPEYHRADVIHLHWINGLVAMRTLRRIKKPIVWTMRDMWPLTGGCHYAIDCNNYIEGCGKCPQLRSNSKLDLSRFIVAHKRNFLPRKMRIIGISEWLSSCAKSSRVFANLPVQTISNNINTQDFFPVPVTVAREALGLPTSGRILLVGAQRVTDFYKGFDHFLQAMKDFSGEDFHVVSFGRGPSQDWSSLAVQHTNLGFLSDTVSLRLAYSAANVFVAPSLMDAFGKTLAEAQACGTPVVCFDATGPRDIIEHKITGYRAEPFEPEDLAKGIHWVLQQSAEQHEMMRTNARKRAVKQFDSRVIAHQYKSLYEEITAKRATAQA